VIIVQVLVSAVMGTSVPRRLVLATLPILLGVWLASAAEVLPPAFHCSLNVTASASLQSNVICYRQASFSYLGLVCGLLSNLCFAVRNVVTPSSANAAADSDALFLAINFIATGENSHHHRLLLFFTN
jgi:hypothetical protein